MQLQSIDNKLDFFNEEQVTKESLIYKSYIDIFSELPKGVPSVRDVCSRFEYDFESKAYDILHGIDKEVNEDMVIEILSSEGCVFKWGGMMCCQAQQMMFDNIFEDEVGFLV